ncbi:MAG: DUF3187 family protein [Candidatus Thiodiazotropha sp. (ex Codakia rugifera)]|nr:DUF3187 family protein [Candidatus Thiodiazotropha sp. (ex Codakia rugifera)]
MQFTIRTTLLLSILVTLCPVLALAGESGYEPFRVRNLNPFTLIHGLPAASSSQLLNEDESSLHLSMDVANNSIQGTSDGEQVTLDGETYRIGLVWKKGVGAGWQMGIEVPYLSHRDGFMDNLIENWHDIFGLSNAKREDWPQNRLRYLYVKDGDERVSIQKNTQGVGDIQLFLSHTLQRDAAGRNSAVHASLKLPTGDSDSLLGSGAPDIAFWISGSDAQLLKRWSMGVYGQAGLLIKGKADILSEQQRDAALFGTVGTRWLAYDWLALKLQVDGHTSLYDSAVDQLGGTAVMITVGGSILLNDGQSGIDISIGENLTTDTVPDFMVNLSYKHSFH